MTTFSMMRLYALRPLYLATLSAITMSASTATLAQQNAASASDASLEEVVVMGKRQAFGSNVLTDSMKLQQSPITSVNKLVDKLPGVSIQEGDTYGFDDWSTTIAMRGFQNTLDSQQIGTTIDGIPNGGSNYGGGAKANRYLDPSNLETAAVSQGTADIRSRSLEALGGTIDFVTSDPLENARARVQAAAGQFDAQRLYARYDTGRLGGHTRAWFSASHQTASDWINGAAENQRDHLAAKLISEFDRATVTAYVSYDDIHEDNYQRLFSPEEFVSNNAWDRLTDTWTGTPWIDQAYRRGWSTSRENLLAYARLDVEPVSGLNLSGGAYYHDNTGRGDWVPPYLVRVVDNQGGPESEALGLSSVNGGGPLGLIYFVDGEGRALSPAAGCVSSLTFPYGGAGPEYDPACYPAGAIAVQSFRNTNYWKERVGFMLDADWSFDLAGLPNTLRGGLWYEDQTRDETRTWHKITDTRAGFQSDASPYWTQYDRTYPQETFKWYVENSVEVADFTLTAGIKQFLVDLRRRDNFQETTNAGLDSDSDVLFSGGIVWQSPIDGLELFAGYSENFSAITDSILEVPDSDFGRLEPETAENIEAGLRYNGSGLFLTATVYDITFNNRIIFLPPEAAAGPNYLIGTDGTFFNAGGIDSSGLELTANYSVTDTLSLYAAYTYNDSKYVGTGDPLVDAGVGVVPGNDVMGIPQDMFVLAFDWARGNLGAGLSGKYTGSRAVTLDNSWAADDYTVVDAYLSYRGAGGVGGISGWNVNLLVNNALDETYLGGIAGQGAWLGAPRTVSASLSVDF